LNDVYGEVFRVLKPGAYFAGYEWVTTDKYDPENAEHVAIINVCDITTLNVIVSC